MSERRHRGARSRSPNPTDVYRRRRSPHRGSSSHGIAPQILPFNARTLSKHDLNHYKPMFALYLSIQKNLDVEELDGSEIKGRWKSFVNKWNRGDLARGWYDPNTLIKALKCSGSLSAPNADQGDHMLRDFDSRPTNAASCHMLGTASEETDDDDYGPVLPYSTSGVPTIHKDFSLPRSGPTIPTVQDLQSRDEDSRTAAQSEWMTRKETEAYDRKREKKSQRERLEDLVPRAAAGTRDRQLEKKQEIAASNRAFATSRDTELAEVQDSELMGGDTMSELKKLKQEQERRKTEREIKREEILRARMAEREERVRRVKEKEDRTMSMLREIARERFGDGNVHRATLKDE